MATLNKSIFVCFFFFSLPVIVPMLHADDEAVAPDPDEYWKHRAELAARYADAAFTSKPEEVTKSLDNQVGKFINGTSNDTEINVNQTRRNLQGENESAAQDQGQQEGEGEEEEEEGEEEEEEEAEAPAPANSN